MATTDLEYIDSPELDALTPKQRLALAAYLDQGTVEAARAAAGVRRSTVYDWMRTDPWRKAISAVLGAYTDAIGHRLALAAHIAVDTMIEVMQSPGGGGPFTFNRVNAATKVIEAADRLLNNPTNPKVPPGAMATGVTFYLPQKGSVTIEATANDDTPDASDE